MIEQIPDNFSVNCDSCPEQILVETHDWHEMIEIIKEMGWRNIPKLGSRDWENKCPVCVKEKPRVTKSR